MNLRKSLHGKLKHYIVNVGWTHKIHIVQSDIYKKYSDCFKVIKIVITALTSAGVFTLFFKNDSFLLKLITAIVSFISLTITGIDKSIDYEKLSIKENQDSRNFWLIREQALSLLSDLQYQTRDINEIEKEYYELLELRSLYDLQLLNTSQKAVKKAKKLIKKCKDNDYSKDYIFFIPKDLLELEEDSK